MSPVVPTVVRVAVILLAVAGAAGHVAYLDALWWHQFDLTSALERDVSRATILLLTAHSIVSVVCGGFSIALVLHEGPRHKAARALATTFAAWSYLMAYSGATMLFRPDPGVAREIFEAHFLVIEVLGLAALIRFTSIFPRRLQPEELAPTETLPAFLLPVYTAAVFMRRSAAPWGAGAIVLTTVWAITLLGNGALSDAGLSPVMDVIRFGAAGIVVMNLRRAWTSATEGDLDALTWLLVALAFLIGALAVLVGGNVLVAVTGFPEPDVAWRPILLDFGLVGFITCVALSVMYRGPLDPALVTRRIVTMAGVVTAGLFFAAGLEALLSGGFIGRVSMRTGIGTAVAFAVVLSTFRSVARLVERVLPI